MGNDEIREIPLPIRRSLQVLQATPAFQDVIEWMANDWDVGEVGTLDEDADYRKGISDAVLILAEMAGLSLTRRVSIKQQTRNDNETE